MLAYAVISADLFLQLHKSEYYRIEFTCLIIFKNIKHNVNLELIVRDKTIVNL